MPRLKQIGIDVDVHRLIEAHRRSFSESPNEILRRLLGADAEARAAGGAAAPASAAPVFAAPAPQARARGRWTVVRGAERFAAANLKHAYRTALLLLDEQFPDFLERFAEERARSRRFVAKSPADLYLASPALAGQHAEPLAEGWYFDTNLSRAQVARRIRIAARLCGLSYGTDLALLDNLEEI